MADARTSEVVSTLAPLNIGFLVVTRLTVIERVRSFCGVRERYDCCMKFLFSFKMVASWDISCSLTEIDRRFRDAYSRHHHGDC
jgi:hypothetical protein